MYSSPPAWGPGKNWLHRGCRGDISFSTWLLSSIPTSFPALSSRLLLFLLSSTSFSSHVESGKESTHRTVRVSNPSKALPHPSPVQVGLWQCHIWLCKKHVLRALDPIHHQGLRIALGAFRTTPIESLYAEAGEPSLEHRRMKLASNYVLKLKSLPRNPCHEVVFEALLSDFSAVTKSESNLVANTFEHFKNANISLNIIDNLHAQCPPPWEEHNITVDISLTKQNKKNTSIQGNENVDKLARVALNRTSTSGKLICYSDLKPKINTYIKSVWQRDWDAEGANKLHEVLPNLGEDLHRRGEGAGRKLETAMCRLRVGHTWLTQSYLLKNEDQPFCYACDSLYTVRHILIECLDFQDTRRKYFSVTDQYRLFRQVNPSRIVDYLKDLGVYGNI
ncbi:ribonuclease hi [Plakobranchus ocellatus]|uniref:Ribonuclease hi n=1 Tax=Plakobranchus ocellatus TaxID=259542 RepID=A0AAV4AYY3_9GAST|nr:ribonuclease hi [Plakobranchus ocellatus]